MLMESLTAFHLGWKFHGVQAIPQSLLKALERIWERP